jgi:hypothetical protein
VLAHEAWQHIPEALVEPPLLEIGLLAKGPERVFLGGAGRVREEQREESDDDGSRVGRHQRLSSKGYSSTTAIAQQYRFVEEPEEVVAGQ